MCIYLVAIVAQHPLHSGGAAGLVEDDLLSPQEAIELHYLITRHTFNPLFSPHLIICHPDESKFCQTAQHLTEPLTC